jgi:hypothetical protein
MYLQHQLMKTLQDDRLRAAARDHLAAEARRARTARRDHAAATGAGATARGAATMPRKQGAIIGLGIPLGAILLFPVLWTMRQLKKSSREPHAGKGGGRSPKSALTRTGTGQNLGATPRDASAAHAQNAQISICGSVALRSTLAAQAAMRARRLLWPGRRRGHVGPLGGRIEP